MARIILTGGSGLVGRRLSEQLLQEGHQITHLASSSRKATIPTVAYDPLADAMPDEARTALLQSDIVIHLAGEPIAARRWSDAQKERIMQSRVASTNLLCSTILEAKKHGEKHPQRFIQASATGYYGDRGDEWVDESSPAGSGFLADTAKAWEEASTSLGDTISTASVRIGIVLDRKGGALPRMALPVKMFLGAIPGSGKQWMSWIHLDDLTAIFRWLVQHDRLTGPFNAVSPEPVQTSLFMQELARALHRPTHMLHIPEAALRLAMGEMAELILSGSRVASSKIQDTGFSFRFRSLQAAFADLFP